MDYPEVKEIKIPAHIKEKWQNIVDIMADHLDVSAALIMRIKPPKIEVFQASQNNANPYEVGDKELLDGLYCEKVIKTGQKLLVVNALQNDNWKDNPDLEYGMISYLGFPIYWPDGAIFGTICILDDSENKFSAKVEVMIKEYKELVETHLKLIYKNRKLSKKENRLNITLQSIGDAVITTDLEGKIDRMNPKAEELTGWELSEAKGKDLAEVFVIMNNKTGKPIKSPVNKVLENGDIVSLVNNATLITKEGQRRRIADSAAPIKDENDKIFGVILVFSDVTKEYETKQALAESEERYRTLFNTMLEGCQVINFNWEYVYINEALEDQINKSRNELIGKKMTEVYPGIEKTNMYTVLQDCMENRITREIENKFKFPDGTEKWFQLRVHPVKEGIFILSNDITERKQREQRVEFMSLHDNLTQLYNRTYFEAEIERLNTKRQLPITMIMIDLNGLKIINDTYGHKIGDKFLVKSAQLLEDIFRQEDIIARWGGDEFVILLTQTNQKTAERLTQRIKKAEKKVNVTEEETMPLSLAVGYAVKEESSIDIYSLFTKAEDMMYKDKLLEEKSIKSHIVKTILATLQEKSQETKEHAERMEKLAVGLGEMVGLPNSELDRLSLLAMLHDIGKTIIPEEILNKPMQLTEEEWEKIKKHPGTGYRICSEVEEFSHIAQEILAHHERWDGKGYPKGLEKEEIPLLSRIITIVDAYDVITNSRVYSPSNPKLKALKEINKCSGDQFDPELVKIFTKMIVKDKLPVQYDYGTNMFE